MRRAIALSLFVGLAGACASNAAGVSTQVAPSSLMPGRAPPKPAPREREVSGTPAPCGAPDAGPCPSP